MRPERKTKIRTIARRGVKTLGWMLAGVLAVVIVAAILLLLRPVRERLLTSVISRAGAALPGTVTVGRADWPGLGTIDLADIHWVDASDTLVAADRLVLSVALSPLLTRDLSVYEIVLDGVHADVPAVTSRLQSPDPGPPRTPREDKRWFPRGGSLPGVPSLAVDRLRASARSIRLGEGKDVRAVEIAASIDLTHGRSPVVRVSTLTATGPAGQWTIGNVDVDIDLASGRVQGRGRGHLLPGWPVFLTMSSTAQDSFFVVVSDSERGVPPGDNGITVNGKLSRDGVTVQSIAFEAFVRTPGVEELSRIPALASALARAPQLQGISMAARGSLSLQPEFTADVTGEIAENDWILGGGAKLRYAAGLLAVDRARLELPDLLIQADVRSGPTSLALQTDVDIRGTRWMKIMRPQLAGPREMKAKISGKISRAGPSPMMTVNVDAAGHVDDFTLDHAWLRGELSLDGSRTSRARLDARANGLALGIAAEFDRGDDVRVRLAPIVLQRGPSLVGRVPAPDDVPTSSLGTVVYSAGNGNVRVENVRVTGAAGDIRLNGRLTGGKTGKYAVRCTWKEPPDLLLGVLDAAPGVLESLRKHWSEDAPYSLDIEGSMMAGDTGPRLQTRMSFVLPGPRAFRTLLPDSARVDDLGPLRGSAAVDVAGRAARRTIDAALDLAATEWVDSGQVHIERRGGDTSLGGAIRLIDGVTTDLSGTIEADRLALDGNLAIPDSRFARRFVPAIPEIEFRSHARLTGSAKQPTVAVRFDAGVKAEEYAIPKIEGRADLGDTGIEVSVRAPRGVLFLNTGLDSVSIECRSESRAHLLPLQFAVDASGSGVRLYQSARVDSSGGWNVAIDTLDLLVQQKDLRSRRPFNLDLGYGAKRIEIDDMELAGTLGRVRARGRAAAVQSDLTVELALAFPDEPILRNLPPGLWPRRLDVDLRARGDSLEADARLLGLVVPGGRRPELRTVVHASNDAARAQISLADSVGSFLDGRIDVAARVAVYPPTVAFRDGPLVLDARLTDFPLAVFFLEKGGKEQREEVARIDGRIRVGGTTGSPSGALNSTVSFREWPALAAYDIVLGAALGDTASAASKRAGSSDPSRGEAADKITASLVVKRNNQPQLTASASYPIRLTLLPPGKSVVTGGRVHTRVESKAFPLDELNAALPPEMSLKGVLSLELTGAGPVGAQVLDGSVSTKNLEIGLVRRARVVASSNLRIGGTSRDPALRGEIDIVSGLIRIPELPKGLHPKEGSAVLLSEKNNAAADPAPVEEKSPAPAAVSGADIDVSIRIPSGFLIRGQGLDVELSGDLRVQQQGTYPRVTGTLRAVRGNLLFLGRTFRLDQGTVIFYGGDELSPSLEVQLSTTVADTKVKVIVSGTAEKPTLVLSSEPHMEEADIVSLLLFGKPYQDLNDSQADMMQRRTAEIFASLGAAQLQEIGGQFGVDVISYRASGTDAKGEFTFGKYLSPQVLLSYVQPLDEQTSPFVQLDYFIRGQFAVQTMYGQRSQTSIGIGWSKDY